MLKILWVFFILANTLQVYFSQISITPTSLSVAKIMSVVVLILTYYPMKKMMKYKIMKVLQYIVLCKCK